MNNYFFDELALLSEFKKSINEAYKNDTINWYEIFGGRDVEIYESIQVSQPKFPCFVVTMIPTPNQATITSCETELYTQVYVRIEHYTQKVDDIGKEELGIMINQRLKQYFQKKYNILITDNREIASPDNSIYRRRIEARIVFNNKDKIIYQGG